MGRKTNKQKRYENTGRPTIMTQDVINKLELGFMMGFNVLECCLYADISTQTYYNYLKKNKDFVDRVERLQQNVSMYAKMNLSESIIKDKNREDSKWHLERRNKNEYSLKQDVGIDPNDNIVNFNINRITKDKKEDTDDWDDEDDWDSED